LTRRRWPTSRWLLAGAAGLQAGLLDIAVSVTAQ
jgi:hypothetical protein